MTCATRAELWRWRERVRKIAGRIDKRNRSLAEPLYQFCDRLDRHTGKEELGP